MATTKKESKDSSFEELVEKIENMTVLEISAFTKALEEKFGISAKDFAMAAPAGGQKGQDEGEGAKIEKTSFDVVLKEAGVSKIQAIKAVKDITGKGLTEAKDMVEKLPAKIAQGVKKEEAEEMKKKLEAAGAVAVLE